MIISQNIIFFNVEYIQPIYFPTNDLQDGQSVTSVGWGQTSDCKYIIRNISA
jgi:hypothetical protein